ncbi:hypothetical protein REPUB_Repub01dG0007300 [Reevesia pubescens]
MLRNKSHHSLTGLFVFLCFIKFLVVSRLVFNNLIPSLKTPSLRGISKTSLGFLAFFAELVAPHALTPHLEHWWLHPVARFWGSSEHLEQWLLFVYDHQRVALLVHPLLLSKPPKLAMVIRRFLEDDVIIN